MLRLIILPPAARHLKKIKDKPLKAKFQESIDEILINPYIGDPKTGDLSGIYCYDFSHNKTNYELAYSLIEENDEIIVVILAGTRENFYKQLKRYLYNT